MSNSYGNPKGRFGTLPVFFTAISTILGAILFLRFGYAVGNLGFIQSVGLILLGHLVTIPTAMAIAEIATNQKVEGGGEYFIISRSFGLNIGSAIGMALFFSQAISVAFYLIAFGEAFEPLYSWLITNYEGITISMELFKKLVSLVGMLLLSLLILTKGASVGLQALYVVVFVLFISLISFFLGGADFAATYSGNNLLNITVDDPDSFFKVFAICFPAFTGMTAGVGLSGDLRDPKKSIPLGTMAGTICGMLMYILICYKLVISASPEALATNQFVMSDIALWGPIIPIGLACATVSSALGSVMVAPRTLQAIANDKIFPSDSANALLSKGKGKDNEPFNASLIVILISFIVIAAGNVNFVAEIITMFFMVTYGSLCMISFLQHFNADPSYRPAFKSRWYLSLLGAIMCVYLMFKINFTYAVMATIIMVVLYVAISYFRKEQGGGMVAIFQGALFQLNRTIRIYLQKRDRQGEDATWRPSVICVTSDTFDRFTSFDLVRWISYKYGFGTYIHQINGYYSNATHLESKEILSRVLELTEQNSNVYVDTIISPSYTSAIAQAIQLPGVAGKANNMILFEFSKLNPVNLDQIVDNYPLVKAGNFDVCILGSSERAYSKRKNIHIWIKPIDYENANLMILLGYIIWGHPDWDIAIIKIFSILPTETISEESEKLFNLIKEGRLPISANNIEILERNSDTDIKDLINSKSKDASLTILGFRSETIKNNGKEIFEGYDEMGSILFVNSSSVKEIQ